MPAAPTPPAEVGAADDRAGQAIAAALAVVQGTAVDEAGRPARRAATVVRAIQAHRPGAEGA